MRSRYTMGWKKISRLFFIFFYFSCCVARLFTLVGSICRSVGQMIDWLGISVFPPSYPSYPNLTPTHKAQKTTNPLTSHTFRSQVMWKQIVHSQCIQICPDKITTEIRETTSFNQNYPSNHFFRCYMTLILMIVNANLWMHII